MLGKVREPDNRWPSTVTTLPHTVTESADRGAELPPQDVDVHAFMLGDDAELSREEVAAVRVGHSSRSHDIVQVFRRRRG